MAPKPKKQRKAFLPLTDTTASAFDQAAKQILSQPHSLEVNLRAMQDWMISNLPQRELPKHVNEPSAEVKQLLLRRKNLMREGSQEEIKHITAQLRKQKKQDRTQAILWSIRNELDIRDKWLGLKRLRKEYTPIPFSSKNSSGNTYNHV
eukprot:5730221-Prorocentrum_lima.AAC.1